MAISDKLTYLNETKSQLKDMINYGLPTEQQITSSTTFRNYVSSIFNAFLEALRTPDTLFTNLPKKSGSGANITLNDTANAPMRIELGATELSQSGTPTPSSPQAVHTISGSNKVVVNGKNLFDKDSVEDGKEISNGTIYNNSSWCVSDYIVVEYNQTYIKNIGNGNDCIIYDKDKNKISTNDRRFTSNKITITEQNAKYIRVNLPLTSLDTYQLEKGNTATTYEPYISQEAEVDLSSKNLFYIKNYSKSGWNITIDNPLKGMSAGDYTISCQNITEVDTAIGFSNVVNNVDSGYYFTGYNFGLTKTEITKSLTQEQLDANYMVFQPNNSSFNKQVLEYMQIMINKGPTKSDYVPYYNPIEYCKIGNYEDKIFKNIPAFSEYDNTLEEGAWYIKKNIGKVVLDGTENWGTIGDNRYYLPFTDKRSLSTAVPCLLKSNYFKATNNAGDSVGIGEMTEGYYTGGNINVFFNYNGSNSDLAGFKTWLGTNKPLVYYILANPTYTQITGTLAEQLENVYQKLLSYSGTTNISQVNTDLSFNMSVSAIEE